MTRAAWIRLLLGLCGAGLSLWVFVSFSSPWLAIPLTLIVFGVTSIIADRVYRAMASPDEQRRDLDDRLRNSD